MPALNYAERQTRESYPRAASSLPMIDLLYLGLSVAIIVLCVFYARVIESL
ncbi:hypothetical protein [Prosthecobacter dejongeii]|uniref:Uncharacterized protein n=1 Tax=Prosthecobacter dejongeii TaxID=48465 RepID=A0A7W7YJK7_9BACT|nr:hypothetical protein [Prosthecobacter dejongeii]MBB5037050.1 hypothetical protein [Prosthecobacter dejongeii]